MTNPNCCKCENLDITTTSIYTHMGIGNAVKNYREVF